MHLEVEEVFAILKQVEQVGSAIGRIPNKAAAIVKEWCLQHQDELLENWQRGQNFEPMERISGADQDD